MIFDIDCAGQNRGLGAEILPISALCPFAQPPVSATMAQKGAQMAKIRLRLVFDRTMLGPGKAELLSHIARTGSISAAGREMGMSYKRAWTLVEEMNTAYVAPLVHSARGGSGGGGATLTETGAAVLAHYRRLEALAAEVGQADIAAIAQLLKPSDMSDGK